MGKKTSKVPRWWKIKNWFWYRWNKKRLQEESVKRKLFVTVELDSPDPVQAFQLVEEKWLDNADEKWLPIWRLDAARYGVLFSLRVTLVSMEWNYRGFGLTSYYIAMFEITSER